MIDKEKTCKDCPDRVVGCHSSCEGYLHRVQRNKVIAENRKADAIMKGYDYDKHCKINAQRIKDIQRGKKK
jgi:hypothetical protein